MKRLCCLILACLCAAAVFSGVACSSSGKDTADTVIDEILSSLLSESGGETLQEYLDETLTSTAGQSGEWIVIALAQSGKDLDFSRYASALREYLSSHSVASAASREKFALVLIACGYPDDPYIEETAGNSIGELGIMSEIYGLHLLNNMKDVESDRIGEVIGALLSRQAEDGGWSLSGQYGDVDITAMTIQALTPHAAEENVAQSIDRALSFLSDRQFDEGDYASFGTRCPESGAQVLTALSGLNIDAAEDARFLKNANSVFDGIALYRLENGGYSHTAGGARNSMATQQVLYSMISYRRMCEHRGPLYMMDRRSPAPDDSGRREEESPTSAPSAPAAQKRAFPLYKIIALAVILTVLAVSCLVLFLKGKRKFKYYFFILLAGAALITFVLLTNFTSTKAFYNGKGREVSQPVGCVVLSISCEAIPENKRPESAKDGYFLKEQSFEIEEGDTVYSVLIDASRRFQLLIDGDGTYIRAINNLSEFDFGDLSGWMYFVNGESPNVGCGSFRLKDRDVIVWKYTKELGKDL